MSRTMTVSHHPNEDRATCSCGQPVASNVLNCTVCGEPVGFPNVRYADRQVERAGLKVRLASARVSARARGTSEKLEEFGNAVRGSQTVISRNQTDLETMLRGDGGLMQAYHPAVRAGLRIPAFNAFDPSRETLDSAINPTFFHGLQFGALSLNQRGVPHYGDFAITLREEFTANRTTVFEENPFTFRRNHPEMLLGEADFGYRATWDTRHELAMAKLEPVLEEDTAHGAFAGILMEQGEKEDGYTDFIECHVYGAISPRTFKHVHAIIVDDPVDRGLWDRMKPRLEFFGITFDEDFV